MPGLAETSEPSASPAAVSRWALGFDALIAQARGGFVSAALAAPLAIGFGMFAFVGLGDEYFGQGVLAGLYAALIVGLVCVLFGDRSGTLYAPRVVTTFFIGALLIQHVAYSDIAIVRNGSTEMVLAIVFAIVFLAGVVQVLFGVLRVATLIRFTPQPVIAGFQNCAAALLVLAQLGHVFGLERHVPLGEIYRHLGEVKPLSICVAGVTVLATWHAKRWVKRTPPVLFGLAVGTVIYYALAGLGWRDALGPALGLAPAAEIVPINLGAFADLVHHPDLVEALPLMLGGAVSIAVIASVDALVCARLLEVSTGLRVSGNAQLVRLGTGNMVAACFGGITAGYSLGPSAVNRSFGGRGRMSVLINAGLTLLLIVAAMPLVAYLPRAVLSGVIVVIGIQHLDAWSVRLARRVFARSQPDTRRLAFDLCVVVLVAVVAIAVDILVAVELGVVLSIALFLARMSRTIVRRVYRANATRARKTREPRLMQYLAERGAVILVIELDGALFFGTAEQLAERVEREFVQETRYVVLDCKRLSEIDSTGGGIVEQVRAILARRKATLVVCGLAENSASLRVLQDTGVLAGSQPARIFADVDRAIEHAEDELVRAELDLAERPGDYPLGALTILRGMDLAEMAKVRALLARRAFAAGATVFRQGDAGDALYIIVAGQASARMHSEQGAELRLMTFGPGTAFGEMGLLERSTRSASVVADRPLECLVLAAEAIDRLGAEHPAIAIKLLANLGRELATRLRFVNRTLVRIES